MEGLFAGIPGDDVRAVLALARRATYRRGEVVFHRQTPPTRSIWSPRVASTFGSDAARRRVALGIHGPGETFGELAV